MTFVLLGFNHETAPVELRERFHLSDYSLQRALMALGTGDQAALSEVVILSTCNRLEIYGISDDFISSTTTITGWLAQQHQLEAADLSALLYCYEGEDVVKHLMRVACGLDSLVLGETQILGQVSGALAQAQAAGTVGALLSHLFQHAAHAGKRARTETDISQHTVSVSHAAAVLAEQKLSSLSGKQAVVIGAGEMAELAAKALQMHGAEAITVVSRTLGNAQALAARLNIQAAEWHCLTQLLVDADMVISATGAPHTVLQPAHIIPAFQYRPDHAMVIVDVAVPRDVEPEVGEMPGIWLYDIDDLHQVVDEHLAQRQAAARVVETLINQEVEQYLYWVHSREVVPVIVDLRRKAEEVAAAEVEQTLRRLPDLTEREQALIEQMAQRIVSKLLHNPTTVLKEQAAEGGGHDYAQAARTLFALDFQPQPSVRKVSNA